MIVCDTGPLVAAADRDDQHNRACTDLLTGLHLARRPILVPAPVVAEVGYLLGRAGGATEVERPGSGLIMVGLAGG